jgi:hypothetical protein
MPQMGFEPTILVFQRANTVHAFNRAAILIGWVIPAISISPRKTLKFLHTDTQLYLAPFLRLREVKEETCHPLLASCQLIFFRIALVNFVINLCRSEM